MILLLALTAVCALAAADVVDDQLEALRTEIDALLLPSGLPVAEGEGAEAQLVALAERSGELSRSEIPPQQKLVANQIELRAYNALANDAARRDAEEQVGLRLKQMRSTALETQELDDPAADATGAFWLLTADLIEVNRGEADLVARQKRAITLLERFLDDTANHASDDESARLVTEVKLALLQLSVQAGTSERACTLLEELQDVDDPRVDDARAICALIGEPADLGNVMLNEEGALNHDTTLLMFVATTDAAEAPPVDAAVHRVVIDWSAQSNPQAVSQAFAIRSLPWYVLVDNDGTIRAIGQTAAILTQVPEPPGAAAPPETSAPNPDAPDTPAPPADPAPAEPDAGAGANEGLDLDDPPADAG